MAETLNALDVARLLARPDGDVRAEIAGKIAAQHLALTPTERSMAEDIFRVMVKDAEIRVRVALSKQLKENHAVPHDVAMSLARDVEEVSLPMLQFSEVLTDEDLVEIIKSQNPGKAKAVAKRATVSMVVSDALVDTNNEEVVATLVSNEGAKFTEATLNKVIDSFAANDLIGGPLSQRKDLPVTVTERLMTKVSENIKAHLINKRSFSPDQVDALLVQAREMAVLGLSDVNTDVEKLVDHLHKNGRLTPSIILRAVCMGDLNFCELSFAKLAKIKVENVRTLLYEAGSRGFDAVYEKTGLPSAFHKAMRAAIEVSSEMEYDGEAQDRERFSRRMIERILTQYGDLGVEFEADDLEYLLSKMNQLPPTLVTS